MCLCKFVGTQWTSVPSLVRFVETVVNTVDDRTRVSNPLYADHYRQTLQLFVCLRSLYPDGNAWYELPQLSRACTTLFEAAVRQQLLNDSVTLRPMWTEMRRHVGKFAELSQLDPSERSFVVAHVPLLRGFHRIISIDGEAADNSERQGRLLRDLLALTSSAIYLHDVATDLLTLRDDVFARYITNTRAQLYGVFAPSFATSPLSAKSAAEVVMLEIDSVSLTTLSSSSMLAYTQQLLERAMNPSLSASVRSAAVTQYVDSPASSHHAVIALLKKLHAAAAFAKLQARATNTATDTAASAVATPADDEQKEDHVIANNEDESKGSSASSSSSSSAPKVDEAVEVVLESVILRVFKTDGVWFVLSYLLSPGVIASAPQRTTATILTNLTKWAPVDRVVSVLRILLEPRRRWAIQSFLHKQIVRLLFDCADHRDASQLFLDEWRARNINKLPADLLHEMLKMGVASLFLSQGEAGKREVAWKVVEELVNDRDNIGAISPSTLVLLLLPIWQPNTPLPNRRPVNHLLREPLSSYISAAGSMAPPFDQASQDDPNSFAYVHAKFLSEEPIYFSDADLCVRMLNLMRALNSNTKLNKHVRLLAQLQQFLFSSSVDGHADDDALAKLHQLLLQLTVNAVTPSTTVTATLSSSASESGTAGRVWQQRVDQSTLFCLNVVPKLFSNLSLQVLIRSRQSDDLISQVCSVHPYAQRLSETMRVLLTNLLMTTATLAQRRMRVSHVVMLMLMEANKADQLWTNSLYQQPFQPLFQCLTTDASYLSAFRSTISVSSPSNVFQPVATEPSDDYSGLFD